MRTEVRERVKDIKRGITEAGGFAVELPVTSLGEQMMKPTTMLYRNFLAMEVEEMLRCHPVDGAVEPAPAEGVLVGGLDQHPVPARDLGDRAGVAGQHRGPEGLSGRDIQYDDARAVDQTRLQGGRVGRWPEK